MTKRLSDYTTLTFDCYGTLIDWESGIWDALQPLIAASGRDDITRAEALVSFARFETTRQAQTPEMLYPEILTRVHGNLVRHYGIATTSDMNAAFGASIDHWPAFPDTADALRRLKQRYRLVILSNVNRAGSSASNRKLGGGLRRHMYCRGRRQLQAEPAHLRLPAGASCRRTPGGPRRDPAHPPEPFPRPRPGHAGRIGEGLARFIHEDGYVSGFRVGSPGIAGCG